MVIIVDKQWIMRKKMDIKKKIIMKKVWFYKILVSLSIHSLTPESLEY